MQIALIIMQIGRIHWHGKQLLDQKTMYSSIVFLMWETAEAIRSKSTQSKYIPIHFVDLYHANK